MASIRNLNKALVREPKSAGAEIERKNLTDKDAGEAPVAPKTAGTATWKANSCTDPFSNRRNDARPVSGKTPRPTEKPGE